MTWTQISSKKWMNGTGAIQVFTSSRSSVSKHYKLHALLSHLLHDLRCAYTAVCGCIDFKRFYFAIVFSVIIIFIIYHFLSLYYLCFYGNNARLLLLLS